MTFISGSIKRITRSITFTPRVLAVVILLAGCADAIGTEPLDQPTLDSANTYGGAVASVTVTPGTASGTVGESAQFTAIAKDGRGRTLSGRTVTWTSANTAVVTVTASGLATAVGGGSTTIRATVGGVVGTASVSVTGAVITIGSVTVSPGSVTRGVGDTAQFVAVVKDGSGSTLSGVTVVWSSSDTTILRVDATGRATAVRSGTAYVVAGAGTVTGKATVTVTGTPAVTVGSVTVTPGTASGSVGQSAQFTAVVKDAAGAVLTGQPVVWSSSNTAVVTVDAKGYGTAVGGGSAAIIATAGGKSGQAAITVTGGTTQPGPVASVSLTPSTLSLGIGSVQSLTATLKDANGTVLSGRAITWTSSNPLVATISALGVVTGVIGGNATITATSEGVSGSATVTITVVAPPPPGGSGTWANEPSGYSPISDNPFNGLTDLGWGMAWNTSGNASIVSDNTAPLSASNVLEMRYPAGFAGGSGPANEWLPLPGLHRMYAGFYWKANAGWQGHSSNVNKILFVFPSSGGDIYIAMYGPPGGPYDLRVLPQYSGQPSEWLVPNVNRVPVTVGAWHKIEWAMDYGTGGANGTIRWWMDGQLIGDYRNVQLPTGGLAEFKINPTWGGVGDSKSQNDYFRYDQIHISGN